MSHIYELSERKVEFVVVPDGFLVHMPHAPSADIVRYRQDKVFRVPCASARVCARVPCALNALVPQRCMGIFKQEFVNDLAQALKSTASST